MRAKASDGWRRQGARGEDGSKDSPPIVLMSVGEPLTVKAFLLETLCGPSTGITWVRYRWCRLEKESMMIVGDRTLEPKALRLLEVSL